MLHPWISEHLAVFLKVTIWYSTCQPRGYSFGEQSIDHQATAFDVLSLRIAGFCRARARPAAANRGASHRADRNQRRPSGRQGAAFRGQSLVWCALRGSHINHYFGHEGISEDCLYLNIWAPEGSEAGDDLPVIVWIYGGGFGIGSAAMRIYAGEELARKGAVYVSIAYRVGALGFMAHPELTAESEHNASGNYGLLDQVAALEWIQKNIAAFGGDSHRVTIMGQSAGSFSVSYLQVSPLGKGLFNGAVGMSGTALMSLMPRATLAEAEATGLAFQKALGVDSLEALRHLPADRVLGKQSDCMRGCPERLSFSPIVDGYFISELPEALFAAGRQNDVPILIGYTHDEGFSGIGRVGTLEEYRSAVNQMYDPDQAAELLALYPASNDEEARSAARAVSRDSTLGAGTRTWVNQQLAHGSKPAFVYMFSRGHPYTPGVTFDDHDPATVGAYHTADTPYWLETLDSLNLFRETRSYTEYDRSLSDLMSSAILEFASKGDPSTTSLSWPKQTAADQRIVEFGASTDALFQVIDWPDLKQIDFMLENPPRPLPMMGPPPTTAARSRD